MKQVNVVTEMVIAKPIAEVSAYAADPDNVPHWYKNIFEVKWLSDHKLEVGARIAFKARFLGRELAYTYKIKTWEPESLLEMATADGPFPMETIYRWQPSGTSGTKMTLTNRGRPSGFSSIFSPFMAMAMKKANKKDLERLKSILETQ